MLALLWVSVLCTATYSSAYSQEAFRITYQWSELSSGAGCPAPTPPSTQWPSTVTDFDNLTNPGQPVCVGTTITERINGLNCVGTQVYQGINSSGWLTTFGQPSLADIPTAPAVSFTVNACFGSFRIQNIASDLRRSNTGPRQAAFYYSIDGGPWAQWDNNITDITTNNNNPTAFSLNGDVLVNDGSTIEFRMVAWNASSVQGTLRLRSLMTIDGSYLGGTQEAPTAGNPSEATCTSFIASWSEVGNATNYTIDLSDSPNFSNLLVDGLSLGDTLRHEFTGLEAGNTYYYRLRTDRRCFIIGAGDILCATSESSDAFAANTLPVSASPENLSASDITCEGFTANWDVVANATGYRLEWSPNSNFSGATGFNVNDPTTASYAISGLQDGATYYYRIRSQNGCGESEYSDVETAAIPAIAVTPQSFEIADITCSGFALNWDEAANAEGYTLEYDENPTFTSPTTVNITDPQTTTHELNNLPHSTTYHCRIRSYNAACGASSFSTVRTVTSLPLPRTDLAVASADICEGEPLSVRIYDSETSFTYTLESLDGTAAAPSMLGDGGNLDILQKDLSPRQYTYRVHVTSGDCEDYLTQQVTAEVYEQPNLTTNPVTTQPQLTETPFDPRTQPVVFNLPNTVGLFTIDFGDGNTSPPLPGGTAWPHFYETGVIGEATIIVDNNGCLDSTQFPINTDIQEGMRIPNVFTPNNDGINDYFIIPEGLREAKFLVFDRWGKQVHSSQELPVRWDGRNMNSNQHCPEGVYTFVLRGTTLQGRNLERNGTITLLR